MSYYRKKIAAFAATLKHPSVITPGLTGADVIEATIGMGEMGHSIYDTTDSRLQDPALHARCAHWLESGLGQNELKKMCSNAKLRISGNKKVLALRLAFKQLPLEYDVSTANTATSVSKKRKLSTSTMLNVKETISMKKCASESIGCKKCGATDHKRCTKLKCPKHPDYEPPL